MKFQDGDRVRITASKYVSQGGEGVIADSYFPYYKIITDYGAEVYCLETELEFSSSRPSNMFQPVAATAQTAPGAPTPTRFKVGDKVIHSGDIFNEVGVVLNVDGGLVQISYPDINITVSESDLVLAPLDKLSKEGSPVSTKCECGAHAVGSSGHSSWCALAVGNT